MKTHFENARPVSVTTPAELDEFDVAISHDHGPIMDEEDALRADREREIFEAQCDAVRAVLFLVKDAPRPRRAVYQLLYMSGAGAACGGSAASIARKFGVSREAFEQEGARLFASLELRKSGLEKSASAKKTYSGTNFRRLKK